MTDASKGKAPRSPFHAGEIAVQEKVGVAERIAAFGRMAIRDAMPDQHRAFFNQLPFIVLSSVDKEGWPRPTILAGPPGFVTSPDARKLSIAAKPVSGDPFEEALAIGSPIGGLGMELPTRRRNRFTARVAALGDTLELAVDQSFGNCPQYIQTRNPAFVRDPRDRSFVPERERMSEFDQAAIELISTADAFFIASLAPRKDDAEDRAGVYGADISHRGGKPGFVRVDDNRTLTIPDFAGNLFFNTFGNILLNPKTGLLFPDFTTGDMLIVAGEAEIIYEGEEIAAFRGAERLLRFRLDHAIRLRGALPLRFEFGAFSPNSLITGDWNEAQAALDAAQLKNTYRPYRVKKIVQESSLVRSFHLEPADGNGLPAFKAGQFLPIRLAVGEGEAPVTRTYTLSNAPGDKLLRISVKREASGLVSRHLHDHIREGDVIEALAPRGQFTVDTSHDRPIVLISGGIGVTPMISMLKHLVVEDFRVRRARPIYFVHAAGSSSERAFSEEAQRLASSSEMVRLHFAAHKQEETDTPGRDIHSLGRVSVDLLKAILHFDDFDFYLCGPAAMSQSIYDGLRELNVADCRIFAEAFGPSALKRKKDLVEADLQGEGAEAPGTGSVGVRFSASGKEAVWTQKSGTLLELAEAAGLSPIYSCRSGSCGSCAVKLEEGAVRYLEEPAIAVEDGMVLTCCSVPQVSPGDENAKIVLDL